jgi:hypothetical protein
MRSQKEVWLELEAQWWWDGGRWLRAIRPPREDKSWDWRTWSVLVDRPDDTARIAAVGLSGSGTKFARIGGFVRQEGDWELWAPAEEAQCPPPPKE